MLLTYNKFLDIKEMLQEELSGHFFNETDINDILEIIKVKNILKICEKSELTNEEVVYLTKYAKNIEQNGDVGEILGRIKQNTREQSRGGVSITKAFLPKDNLEFLHKEYRAFSSFLGIELCINHHSPLIICIGGSKHRFPELKDILMFGLYK